MKAMAAAAPTKNHPPQAGYPQIARAAACSCQGGLLDASGRHHGGPGWGGATGLSLVTAVCAKRSKMTATHHTMRQRLVSCSSTRGGGPSHN
jgi:hypothetical protein